MKHCNSPPTPPISPHLPLPLPPTLHMTHSRKWSTWVEYTAWIAVASVRQWPIKCGQSAWISFDLLWLWLHSLAGQLSFSGLSCYCWEHYNYFLAGRVAFIIIALFALDCLPTNMVAVLKPPVSASSTRGVVGGVYYFLANVGWCKSARSSIAVALLLCVCVWRIIIFPVIQWLCNLCWCSLPSLSHASQVSNVSAKSNRIAYHSEERFMCINNHTVGKWFSQFYNNRPLLLVLVVPLPTNLPHMSMLWQR